MLLLAILGILILINTTLGSLMAKRKKEFNWNKFSEGIVKALIITLCMTLFCICISLIPMILKRVGISIPNDLITILELLMMILTAYKKYSLDCFDKLKKLLGVE